MCAFVMRPKEHRKRGPDLAIRVKEGALILTERTARRHVFDLSSSDGPKKVYGYSGPAAVLVEARITGRSWTMTARRSSTLISGTGRLMTSESWPGSLALPSTQRSVSLET
jgi:hypothetical protein